MEHKEILAARVCALASDLSGVRVERCALPAPAPNEVQVQMKAVSLNFPDVLMCSGGYQFKPELPFTLGMEGAGIICALGEGVTGLSVGDEVICGARSGLAAEAVNLPVSAVRAKSRKMDWAQAASFSIAWRTALTALEPIGKLQKGERVLVFGAGGGVGLAAVDVAVKMGAEVFAVASSQEKRRVAKEYGAHFVLPFDEALPEEVKTRGGVDVAYDPVGGDAFSWGLRCLRWRGRMLVIGFASGTHPTLAVNYALIKGLSVIGVRAGEFARHDPKAGAVVAKQLEVWANEGLIKPHIGAKFKLSDIAEGLRLMAARGALGKICVMIEE